MNSKLKFLIPLFLGGILSNSASASIINFDNPIFSTINNTISVGIHANFDESTSGGDFIFEFDKNALGFVSYTSGGSGYDMFNNDDGDYTISMIDTNDDLNTSNGISAGNYFVGTLKFNVSKAGDYEFSASNFNFYKLGFEETQDIHFAGSKISVTPDMILAVSEPSEFTLMLLGLTIFALSAKAKKAKNIIEIKGR